METPRSHRRDLMQHTARFVSPMFNIIINPGGNYTADLDRRLKKYHISHNELAREMKVSPSQMSRWFNKPMQPRLESIVKIEKAIVAIRARRAKERKKKAT